MVFTGKPAAAVSLSGILLYSTDDFGNPNGYQTFNAGTFEAQTWRTLVRSGQIWYGLGVASGLPPKSIEARLLNFPDFSVDVALDEGENYFTFFAEPGPNTAGDEFERFAINLYFDGDTEKPAITVLFPRYGDPDGSPVSAARPNDDQIYSLGLQKVPVQPQDFYDDGVYRVSVLRASLLDPQRANVSTDRVSNNAPTPGGDDSDWVGTLTISVEPTENFGAGGGGAPVGSGSSGGGNRGALGGNAQPRPGSAGYLPPQVGGQQQLPPGDTTDDTYAGGGSERTPGEFWKKGGDSKKDDAAEVNGTPTPPDVAADIREWQEKETARITTPTPGATGTPATATPGASTPTKGTPVPATPTPVMTSSHTPVPTAPLGAAPKKAAD